jgi:SNF2 family DNA or RNA helicase
MTELFDHQKEGIKFLMEHKGSGALIWEPGCAKTRTVIETAKEMLKTEPGLKFLVVCPLSILQSVWGEQIEQYSDFSFMNCHKDGIPDNPRQADALPDFMLINYESIRLERNVLALSKLLSNQKIVAILDESSKIKAHDTITTKTLLRLASKFHARIIMSGTPTPNSELEWWPQMNFVQPWVLGSSFSQFKNTFFHWQNRNGQIMNIPQGAFMTREVLSKLHKTGCEMAITPANRERLMKMVTPFCSLVRKVDCLDLPEEIDMVREVNMTEKQSRAYKDMKTELIAQLGDLFDGAGYIDPIVAQNGLTKIAKLREITSGFAINDRGQEVDLGSSPKLTELMSMADEYAGQQLIIWGNYKWEIRTISEALSKIAPVSTFYGETKDRDGSIEAFQKGDTRFFVANPQSAGHGLNLQGNCSNEIFFSLSYSMEQYIQARGRIHRSGQTKACIFNHIIARGTIDQEILDVVRGKKTAQDILLNMIPKHRMAA